MDEELERFKHLKLHEYAASLGYELDARETSKRETIMRKGGDKISIRKDADGHYVYYSFRDVGDHGTILDLAKRRLGINLGEVRKALRVWSGSSCISLFQELEDAPRSDRASVSAEYQLMRELRWHDYLEQERKIPRAALLSYRFKGCIRVDAWANAIFPHHDEHGLCGFEKRGGGFKGFADLGEKGLWMSNPIAPDIVVGLVIGESAIDCISHYVLFPQALYQYASIAGGLNPKQPGLILQVCQAMPAGSEVVSITHPDPDGDRYAEVIRKIAQASSLSFRRHLPAGVKDWNDRLRQSVSDTPVIGL